MPLAPWPERLRPHDGTSAEAATPTGEPTAATELAARTAEAASPEDARAAPRTALESISELCEEEWARSASVSMASTAAQRRDSFKSMASDAQISEPTASAEPLHRISCIRLRHFAHRAMYPMASLTPSPEFELVANIGTPS